MKIKITFIISLFFGLTFLAQTNTCGSVVNNTFDVAGDLPVEWTEYNSSGNVTVDTGQLKFNFNATLPSAYRTFTAISNNVIFSFDVSASRTYSSCQVHLISATGEYLSSIDVGSKSSSIKYATTMSSSVPSGYTNGSPKVTLQKNTFYSLKAHVNFTNQTIDYYADDVLMQADVPFLESANNVEKVDIQTKFMYNNSGYFNFDNIILYTSDEHRLLSKEIITAKALLDNAVIGNASQEYPQNDYNVFQTAINTATSVEDNCSSTQSELNLAYVNLNSAITDFKASRIPFDGSVTIDALDTEQKIVMIGGDMERNAGALQAAPNKTEIVDWLIKDIPFNTFRVKYDKTQEMTEGDVDMGGAYANQILSMKMILQANPNMKFFATMKSDYHGYSQGNRNNLPTFIYDYAYDSATETSSGTKSFYAVKYGRFLADYIEHMSDNGVPITYLSTSKEWTSVMTAARAKTTIQTLISILAARNVDMPLIIDSGAWSLTAGVNTVNSYVSNNVDQYVYGYSAHKYGGNKTWVQYGNAVKNTGKLAINDESSHGGGGQTTEDEVPITNALFWYTDKCNSYKGGVQGELFFEVWMKNGNLDNYYARPIVFTSSLDGRRMRSYYIMKKFAESVHDATYVKQSLSNFDNVSSMAFIKDNKLTLWMINSSETDYADFPININNLGLKQGMTIRQVNWNETAVITGDEKDVIANEDNQFNVDIAPLSLTCFEIDLDNTLSTDNFQTSRINIYPNPVSDKLKVSDPDALFKQYTIYNINGQVMRSGKMSTKEVEINVNDLSIGIYLLKLEGNTTSETHKLIKK